MSFAPVEISTASGIARADEVVQLVELRLQRRVTLRLDAVVRLEDAAVPVGAL